MRRFSQLFGINLDQPQLDFVDITPSRDIPLFLDPFAISIKGDVWSAECHAHITHFFETALSHIQSGREEEARMMLNGLGEPNETCLGYSSGRPAGRGVSGKQALDLYDSLANSQAAHSGLLSELADCDLFVEGIGRDKISDITTNIIRKLLIQYTQDQCRLHGIKLDGEHPSGRYWDMENRCWRSEYTELPVIDGRRIILVPKYSVRRTLALNAQEFYSHQILNFIQEEEMRRRSPLVRVLKSGEERPPFKKTLRAKHPFSKDFIAHFAESNPQVLAQYKKLYSQVTGAKGTLDNRDFDEDLDEGFFAHALQEELQAIPPGLENASTYHKFMVGALQFIFWPNLIYPHKEQEINQGRKRIDIKYTNAAKSGFFYRVHTAHKIASNWVMVECKNYSSDPKNPEIDQLLGRFSVNRGKLGILLFRNTDNRARLISRCRDAAQADNGFVIPLSDIDVFDYLELIKNGHRGAIDQRVETVLDELLS